MHDHLYYMVHHVFLPPQLPQQADSGPEKDFALTEALLKALASFVGLMPDVYPLQWKTCIKMLSNMMTSRDDYGGLVHKITKDQLQQMEDGDLIALCIRSQNAGLLIRRSLGDYSFESFELSPTTAAVIQTKGRLRRIFPGPAVAIGANRMEDDSFAELLVEMIVKLDAETPEEVYPVAKKAKMQLSETRDTVHPKFITQMLTGILAAIGSPIDVKRIHKHIRDDVLWKDALYPWRRSPLWLLLRVALQTEAVRDGVAPSSLSYKSFMLFFMAQLLEKCIQASLPSDILSVMLAKISCRALKLNAAHEEPWLKAVESTVISAKEFLSQRWSKVEDNTDPLGAQLDWHPSELSYTSDIWLQLEQLRPYLARVSARPPLPPASTDFVPGCSFRIAHCNTTLPKLRCQRVKDEVGTRLALADFESWVEDYLQDWLGANIEHSGCCKALATTIRDYTSTASTVYKDTPEDYSLMILTVMELWRAIDESATRHYPLLQKYSVQIVPEVFEPLLLPRKAQMQRLSRIEDYLRLREESARPSATSIFGSTNTRSSLAVQFFDQSSCHQRLKQDIEAGAERERSEKQAELANKRKRYKDLMEQSSAMECQWTSTRRRNRQVSRHSGSCLKCQLKNTARAITIDVHEWPLPDNDVAAKATVFELAIPAIILEWRDTLYRILADLLSIPEDLKTEPTKYPLLKYSGLECFRTPHAGRVQSASSTKSFTSSHYRSLKITQADEKKVCVKNGLIYELFDTKSELWTSKVPRTYDIRPRCTFELPHGTYRSLQYAVSSTNHTSNHIIASQSTCPDTLTLHEFYSFGTLRCGHRLQWRNIGRELTTQVLNFSCEETHQLCLQAAWQVGPTDGSNFWRESHEDLREGHFGRSLISALTDAFTAVEGNWQGAVAARTFSRLASRLLSLTSSHEIQQQCCRFLRRVRNASQLWMRKLEHNLREESKERESGELGLRLLEVALTCHQTFDVDGHHFSKLLFSDDDIGVVMECLITIHDRCPANTNELPKSIKILLRRHGRLTHRLEPFLMDLLIQNPSGLNGSVGRIWSGYSPGSEWSPLRIPDERWLVTQTSDQGGPSLSVQFNLLDGSLLVNGLPLTRLPRSYESHATYQRLFGQKVFDVVPSTMRGMVFECRDDVSDHRLYFRIYDSDLVVRAAREGQIWELLPLHALGDDFPVHFCQDFAHWLEVGTGFIEFRPLSDPWTSKRHNWWMQPGSDGKYTLTRDSKMMIDFHSRTAKTVSVILRPLESRSHVHVVYDIAEERLEVHLPRLKLGFFRSRGAPQLESKQFREMFVDTNQSFGSFTGLLNKLVLRGSDESIRSVIIPHGDVAYHRKDDHVLVEIHQNEKHGSYHLYQVDAQLGRLVDNGSLKSKLFKCYLHAVTSHCLRDQLTNHTGTEEALSILSSSSIQSFQTLSEAECEILKLIARLTPRRSYYPSHLRVMQTVEWQKLSPLSQHTSFMTLARLISKQGQALSALYDQPGPLLKLVAFGDQDLHDKAIIRDSTYRVQGFGAEDHVVSQDIVYKARDNVQDSTRESYVYKTARLVDRWSTDLQCCPQLMEEIESWQSIVCGYTGDIFPIGFDLKWLEPYASFMPAEWCTIQAALSHCERERDRYRVMFLLCTLAYSRHAKQNIVETLLAFATVSQLRSSRLPQDDRYHLSDGYTADRTKLVALTEANLHPFESCPESDLPQLQHETWADTEDRRADSYQSAVERHVRSFVDALILQWPRNNVSVPTGNDLDIYISTKKATQSVEPWFQSWYRNLKFRESICSLQVVLDTLHGNFPNKIPYMSSESPNEYHPQQHHISLDCIFDQAAPALDPPRVSNFDHWIKWRMHGQNDQSQLQDLLRRITSTSSVGYEQDYATDLARSINSLESLHENHLNATSEVMKPVLEDHLGVCKADFLSVHNSMMDCLQAPSSITHRLVVAAGMGPRLSTVVLLRHLAGTEATVMRDDWKSALVQYGLALSELQCAIRLIRCRESPLELLRELLSLGHRNWNPHDYPGWLVFEIENDISIRPVQGEITRELISPSSSINSVLQLNMGEGKSSVIVPLVAWALADGTKLVRIVVLKPLSQQMLYLLVRKLSGLLGRRIYQMPISRSLRIDDFKARQIRALCEECMRTGGVLLVQPEHLLSFELMGVERLASHHSEVGTTLIETQRWLDRNTRDILDESDEILSVRFELVYTMGTQRAIDLCPDRWAITQSVLELIGRHAEVISRRFPQGLELRSNRQGGFPHLRILQRAAGQELLRVVAREICAAGLPGLPVWNLSSRLRALLLEYLTDPQTSGDNAETLRHAFSAITIWKSLLLVKGLISDGILLFALQQKRWRVNYGLDLSRTMLAVPYHAMDTPSSRAEFSHPDATIVLTCLSYYYGGLSDPQLMTAFEKLLRCDHAQEEYEAWVKDAENLPASLHRLSGINLSDPTQCSQMTFPSLRRAKGVIDFYLAHVVFPKEMREFTQKLSSSGWEIAREKGHPTTGFSGTNDSRYILPLSIRQCDLPSQLSTNALVLKWILQPENSFQCAVNGSGKGNLDAQTLLGVVLESRPPVRVILDVGAQVLEWKNEEVGRKWLSRVPVGEAQAVVFFNDLGDLSILSREGMVESFTTSPFASQMDQCLVYLDESHTRGTDLKLPIHYRAAVTLGPRLTKDRLMQACMRMRKLGRGQSVMFCAPVEIERKILQCNRKMERDSVEVIDVLRWSIAETCSNMRESVPLWVIQGLRCQRRYIAWSKLLRDQSGDQFRVFATSLLEAEAQTLQDRYGSSERTFEEDLLLYGAEDDSLSPRQSQVNAIRAKCQEFRLESFQSASLREEQERELSPENEQEREVEQPPAIVPMTHIVHQDVATFVRRGIVDRTSPAFCPAFKLFAKTSAKQHLEAEKWPPDVLITADFAKTVRVRGNQALDAFLRPVHWVAKAAIGTTSDLVVLSPHEAHELLPSIRRYRSVVLHTYSARVNFSVRSFDDLSFCVTPEPQDNWAPPRSVMLLNLFAGQLYLSKYDAYLLLCDFLGLCTHPPPNDIAIGSDGFISPQSRSRIAIVRGECLFQMSPVPFLRTIMMLRRKGQIFRDSHIGKILNGGLLGRNDF